MRYGLLLPDYIRYLNECCILSAEREVFSSFLVVDVDGRGRCGHCCLLQALAEKYL